MIFSFKPSDRCVERSDRCVICGETRFEPRPVLGAALISAWGLAPEEVDYVNRQQGLLCLGCGSNLRSRTLAAALLDYFECRGTLKTLSKNRRAHASRILEINEAGTITPWLLPLKGHVLARYPDVDMQVLPYPEGSWDVVLHSDVLEHIPDPSLALRECYRVLSDGGVLLYTVPVIHGRMSRSRQGLPPSFHGAENQSCEDMLVHTEFGADFWLQPIEVGFRDVRLLTLSGPDSIAIVCRKRNGALA